MLRSRRATEFDPALVDLLCVHAGELLDGVSEVDAWDAVITGDGDLGPELSEARLEPGVRLRALLPAGPLEMTGREEVAGWFHRVWKWIGTDAAITFSY